MEGTSRRSRHAQRMFSQLWISVVLSAGTDPNSPPAAAPIARSAKHSDLAVQTRRLLLRTLVFMHGLPGRREYIRPPRSAKGQRERGGQTRSITASRRARVRRQNGGHAWSGVACHPLRLAGYLSPPRMRRVCRTIPASQHRVRTRTQTRPLPPPPPGPDSYVSPIYSTYPRGFAASGSCSHASLPAG